MPSYPPHEPSPVVSFHILITAKEFHAASRATEPFIGSVSTTSFTFPNFHIFRLICICRYLYLNLGQHFPRSLPHLLCASTVLNELCKLTVIEFSQSFVTSAEFSE